MSRLALWHRNDRIRNILMANAFFYVLVLMAVLSCAFTGIEIDTMLAVSIIFYAFPKGLAASMILLGVFNLYAWVTE